MPNVFLILLAPIHYWPSFFTIGHHACQITTYFWLLFIRYEKVTSLKNINPNLKILLGVSGWNTVSLLGSWPNSKQFRTNFIDHTIAYLRQRNFDGIDLNWAGPTARRKRPVNRNIFTDMLQVRHLSLCMRKTTNWVSDQAYTNRPVQPQNQARCLKFRI